MLDRTSGKVSMLVSSGRRPDHPTVRLTVSGLGLGSDLHVVVLVSVLWSTFMQLLSACGVRVRVEVRGGITFYNFTLHFL